ncbi:hypothetical protein GQ473_03145 [archaeon]|nr:hypothetical protein [archaeon]
MTTFREEVLKRYMVSLNYKSHSTGRIYKLKEIQTRRCENRCRGEFGTCDGTQLIFTDDTAGCIFDLSGNTRFKPVAGSIQKTNVRW